MRPILVDLAVLCFSTSLGTFQETEEISPARKLKVNRLNLLNTYQIRHSPVKEKNKKIGWMVSHLLFKVNRSRQ